MSLVSILFALIVSLSSAQAKPIQVSLATLGEDQVINVVIRPVTGGGPLQREWFFNFRAPGIENTNLYQGAYKLWVSDPAEQKVYCLGQKFDIPEWLESEPLKIVIILADREPCTIVLPEVPARLRQAAASSQGGGDEEDLYDLDEPLQFRWPNWLDLGIGYRYEDGSHGDGRDRPPGAYYTGGGGGGTDTGILHGLRATAGVEYRKYSIRGYFVWGMDPFLPEYEETCMAGGFSPGYQVYDYLNFWMDLGYQVRGVAVWEVDGNVYNLYKGFVLGPAADFHLWTVNSLVEIHLEPSFSFAWGTYEDKSSSWFLAFNAGIGF